MAHQSENDLNVGRIFLIGLVSVLITVALIEFLQVLFYGLQANQLAAPQFNQLPAEMSNYVADQQGKLVSYEVVDQGRQVVTIPIDRAMDVVLDELDANPQANVTGVPAPPPAGPTDPNAAGPVGESEPEEAADQPEVPPPSDSPPAAADQESGADLEKGREENQVPPPAAATEGGLDDRAVIAEPGESAAEPETAGPPGDDATRRGDVEDGNVDES